MNDIIDNINIKLINVLKQKLSISKKARFCIGWLFLSGFKELRNEIDKLDKLEILAGSRTNKQTVELMLLEKKWEEAVNNILKKNEFLNEEQRNKILEEEFKGLLDDLSYIKPTKENVEFLKWFLEKIKEGKIEIRIYYKEPLHAKLYLFELDDSQEKKGEAILGSSNFSLSGFRLNTELNILISENEKFDFFYQWFENLWQESEKTDFTALVQEVIENCWAFNKEVTPFRIYLKVLHEIFSYKEPEPQIELDVELYRFQKDAVIDAYRKLKKYNGVFISDVPGLGKTYIGSALLSHLESEGYKSIVIVPPRLVENWKEVLSDLGVSKAKVFSSGKLDEILDNEKYLNREVVVIDESHHFRNPDTKKYRDMQRICYNKKVILLSATPQNLSIWDLYYQIKLFTPYESNHNFRIYPIRLDEYFKECEKNNTNIDDLISQIFIRRTRSDIKEYYTDEKIIFPQRVGPYRIDYSIDEVYPGGLYNKLEELINKLNYARYNLSKYAKSEDFDSDEFQRLNIAWNNLQRLIRINFYRRLESSVKAFKDTLSKNLKNYKYFLNILENRNQIFVGNIDDIEDISNKIDLGEDLDFNDEVNNYKFYDASNFDVEKLLKDLKLDIQTIEEMFSLIKDITPEEDDKLQALINKLNDDLIKDKKIIIFSSFESTVKYLYENLKDKFEKVDYVCGGENFLNKIYKFAPKANNRKEIKPEEEIKILIATEILSEGLNLQDGEVIINYDLHWNPVRIIQRIGRIDRIGSKNDKIFIYNFFPETQAEKNIKIEDKINKRINEIMNNFGFDEKIIDINQEIARKKLFEIYTEKPEGLEEIEEKSLIKYFENQFMKLKKEYPEEYQKSLELPNMVNIARNSKEKGIIVFCRAGDYFRLRMVDLEGKIINYNDAEILKILECEINEVGEEFNKNYFDFIDSIRNNFEEEANKREQDRREIYSPIKKEFEKLINWLKRRESNVFKNKLDELLNFVLNKNLNYEQEKELRKILRNYPRKFGLHKKEILKELKDKIYNLLENASNIILPEIEYKYAQVIIAEELK